MAFSTWSNLLSQMRNDFASGSWRTKSYDFDGMKKEFFAPEEFLKMYSFVENKAREESYANNSTRTVMRGANR